MTIIRGVMAAAVVAFAATLQGCGVVGLVKYGQWGLVPMTPEESKAQVVDAARDIVHTLGLRNVGAVFQRMSCNDQNEPPCRAQLSIDYPHPPTYEESQAQVAAMVEQLRRNGWEGDPGFHSHGAVVQKNNVVAEFVPYHPKQTVGGITLFGECRDITTKKSTMQEVLPPSELQ
jgi:hypothetical protein